MPLHRIKEFDPDYRNHFDNQDVIGSDVYSGNEKIGSVDDLLVDESGNFRYFVVNTGLWIFLVKRSCCRSVVPVFLKPIVEFMSITSAVLK